MSCVAVVGAVAVAVEFPVTAGVVDGTTCFFLHLHATTTTTVIQNVLCTITTW